MRPGIGYKPAHLPLGWLEGQRDEVMDSSGQESSDGIIERKLESQPGTLRDNGRLLPQTLPKVGRERKKSPGFSLPPNSHWWNPADAEEPGLQQIREGIGRGLEGKRPRLAQVETFVSPDADKSSSLHRILLTQSGSLLITPMGSHLPYSGSRIDFIDTRGMMPELMGALLLE